MPVVLLKVDYRYFTNQEMGPFAKSLSRLASEALSFPGNKVSPESIKVHSSEISPFSVNTGLLEIVIFAHDYPDRRENLDDRAKFIAQGLRKEFPLLFDFEESSKKNFVLIFLGSTGLAML